jgi:hypothetical protein
MQAYDALPADLRQWLADAVLPWSAESARRVWAKALKSARGDRQAAQAALSALERKRLKRDVARVWGKAHPFLAAPEGAACADAGRRDHRPTARFSGR